MHIFMNTFGKWSIERQQKLEGVSFKSYV